MAHKSKRSSADLNSTESAEDILKRIVPQGHRGLMMTKCPFCSYSKHTHPNLFKDHLRIHTGEKPYKCEVCNKEFVKKCNLKSHHVVCQRDQKKLNGHLTVRQVPQLVVNPVNTTCENPRINKEGIHWNPKPTGPRKGGDTKDNGVKLDCPKSNTNEHSRISPQCFICFKKFCSLKELHAHLSVHTVDKPYICPVCKCGFFQWEALKNHSTIHSEENSKVSEEIVLELKPQNEKANQLNPEVKSENKTMIAPLKLSKEPSHKACICNYCKTGFIDENALIQHSKKHLDLGENRQWGCNHCQETFLSHGEINFHHRQTHRNEKQWLCQECRKRVKCSTELIRHLYIHTGEKPFECNMCDKAFNQKISLVLHLRSHTAEKALKYSIGDMAFNRKRSLKIQAKLQAGEKRKQTKLVFQSKVMSVNLNMKLPLDEEISHSPSHRNSKDDEVSKTSKCSTLPSELSEETAKIVRKSTVCQNHLGDHEKSYIGDNQTNAVFKSGITNVDMDQKSSTDEDIKNLQCDKKLEQEKICFTNIESPKNLSPKKSDNNTGVEKPLKRNACSKGFNLKRNQKVGKTSRLHTGKKSFNCNIGQKRFNKKSNLKTHVYTHSEERRFKCNICDKGFRAKRKLDDHYAKFHNGVVDAKLVLRTKVANVNPEIQMRTDEVLNKEFENKIEESADTPITTIEETPSAISKSFICKYCKTGFVEPTTLKLHSKTHTGKRPWVCNQCQKSFHGRTQFNSHLQVSHPRKKLWICQVCQKRFNNSANLYRHLLIHSGEKPFKCNFCNKRWTQKGGLAVHLRIHTGEKPFKCKLCDKAFSQKVSLRAHGRLHTRETPFKCNNCFLHYKREKDLMNHMLSHTKDKHFTCNICNKRFRMEYELKVHLRSHTREKKTRHNCQPEVTTVHLETQTHSEQNQMEELKSDKETGYEMSCYPEMRVMPPHVEVTVISDKTIKVKPSICKYCKTGFVNSSTSSHIHTGNERWICNHCQQSFPRETILKYHYRKFHRGENHCICEECKKRFKLISELSNHLLEHTGVKTDKCITLDSRSSKRARNSLGIFTVRKNSECTVTELTEDKSNSSEPLRQISDNRNNETTSFNINPEERARQWSCFLNVFNVKIAKQVMTHS